MMKPKLLLTILSLFFATTFAEKAPDTANFNVIHGRAYYNATRTPGEAPSVHRNINTPYLMYGSNYVAFGPTDVYGVVSYTSGEHTSFLAYMNSQAILGVATKSLGFSFEFSVGEKLNFLKQRSSYHKDEISEIVGSSANKFTFRLALPFNSIDFLGILQYSQTATDSLFTEEYADSEGKSKKEYNGHDHSIYGYAAFSNKPSAKNFSWIMGASATRRIWSKDSSFKNTEFPDENYKFSTKGTQNYLYAGLFYNFGVIVLKSKNARLHIGNNSSVSAYIYDILTDKENERKDTYLQGYLTLTPHILAEYVLNENWMFWGATYYSWSNVAYREKYIEAWKTRDETRNTFTSFSSKTGTPYMSTGARFNYKRISVEAGIEAGMYSNPFRGFNGQDMIYDISGMITF